jgi:hypothetical protein
MLLDIWFSQWQKSLISLFIMKVVYFLHQNVHKYSFLQLFKWTKQGHMPSPTHTSSLFCAHSTDGVSGIRSESFILWPQQWSGKTCLEGKEENKLFSLFIWYSDKPNRQATFTINLLNLLFFYQQGGCLCFIILVHTRCNITTCLISTITRFNLGKMQTPSGSSPSQC